MEDYREDEDQYLDEPEHQDNTYDYSTFEQVQEDNEDV